MTIEQAQCLLKYLGYYVGAINGKNGTLTKVATKAFQKDFGGISVDGVIGHQTEKAMKHAVAYGITVKSSCDFWDEIEYFTRDEFACPCPRCGGFPAEPKEKLVRMAEQVRKHFDSAALVSSGVRCQEHNDELSGSVPNSRHILGKAVDFRIKGKSGAAVLAYVQTLPGVRYAYNIDGTYVHMDIE